MHEMEEVFSEKQDTLKGEIELRHIRVYGIPAHSMAGLGGRSRGG